MMGVLLGFPSFLTGDLQQPKQRVSPEKRLVVGRKKSVRRAWRNREKKESKEEDVGAR